MRLKRFKSIRVSPITKMTNISIETREISIWPDARRENHVTSRLSRKFYCFTQPDGKGGGGGRGGAEGKGRGGKSRVFARAVLISRQLQAEFN